MTTNDFVPIGTAGGANVETQVAYVADPVRPLFYGDGVIPDAKVHGKMFRQASIIISQFCQMVCDYSGLDMLDDGDLATLLATMKTQFRIRTQANITFYVRIDGNDANTGLANNAGGAWRTVQHAFSAVSKFYDVNGFQPTVSVGAGSFLGGALGPVAGLIGIPLILNGAGATTIFTTALSAGPGGYLQIQNVKFAPGLDNAVVSSTGGIVTVGAGVDFGACGAAHLYANNGLINVNNNYAISGTAAAHYQINNKGQIDIAGGITITLTGTPGITAFATVDSMSFLNFSTNGGVAVFAGGATGQRYLVDNLSMIFTNGSGANYLPGNSAGVNGGHGAQYN